MNPVFMSEVPARDGPFATAATAALLMCVLDEIDYAMLLVTAEGGLRYANQLALSEVLCEGPLRISNGLVRATTPADQHTLHDAVLDALRGRRRLVTLNGPGPASSVAVLPLPCGESGTSEPVALLVFGKRRYCEALTIDFFSRSHGLTGTEARVLHALCQGDRPKEIAAAAGVAISTVRTHVSSIRQKTRSDSIGELVHRVTALPPITSAIKHAAYPAAHNPRAAAVASAVRLAGASLPVGA